MTIKPLPSEILTIKISQVLRSKTCQSVCKLWLQPTSTYIYCDYAVNKLTNKLNERNNTTFSFVEVIRYQKYLFRTTGNFSSLANLFKQIIKDCVLSDFFGLCLSYRIHCWPTYNSSSTSRSWELCTSKMWFWIT
jgi:hypothetical protein